MLIECMECGRQISDRATACPGCGCPNTPVKAAPMPTETHRSPKTARNRHRLPNGCGTIRKLSGRRSRPYAAYPPVQRFHLNGTPVQQPAIGYFENYKDAYAALAEFQKDPYDLTARRITFGKLYERWYEYKYNGKRQYSDSTKRCSAVAFNNTKALHDRMINDIRVDDLQKILDDCPLKHASLEHILLLFRELWSFANKMEYTTKDPARYVKINVPDDDERGEPFTEEELELLWHHKDNEVIRVLLILCYTGFRIAALKTWEVNLAENYLKGGVKTKASKGRIVPIHPAIRPLVEQFDPAILNNTQIYRNQLYEALEELGIARTAEGKKHTPHDGRHTFSWLCDRYGVTSVSKHKLMGHAQGSDIEETVYGHRTLPELRAEINKIRVPEFVTSLLLVCY